MRTGILFVVSFFCSVALIAQEKMYIHKSDKMTLGALVAETDSVYFNEDETVAYFRIGDTLEQ
jgi:hypothetical protein